MIDWIKSAILNKKIAIAALLIAVGIVYSNSLISGFVLDDRDTVINKSAFFSHPENTFSAFAQRDTTNNEATPYYRPLNTLTYMLDHYLWGLNPLWYHLEDVLLHALVVVFFYLLVARVFEDELMAFFSALLFAVYPVCAEAVNFISARNTLLCALFLMASLLALSRKGAKWTALSFAAYFLALLSKEPAVVEPFFLLTFTLFARDEKRFRVGWKTFAGFFVITAVYFLIRQAVLGVFASNQSLEFSVERLKFMSAVLFENFHMMLWPFSLNAYYSMLDVFFTPLRAVIAVSGLAALLYLSIGRGTSGPVRAGAQWIVWGLLPVSNIVMIPSAPVAERYQYTILFGFVLILGYAIAALYRRRALPAMLLLALLVIILGARTFQRNFDWRGNLSIYRSMVRSDPGNPTAHYYLARSLYDAGRFDESAGQFQAALARQPDYPEASDGLGLAYMKTGDLEGAVREFRAAVSFDSDFYTARIHLGVALAGLDRLEDAAREFRGAVELNPQRSDAHLNLAITRLRQGLTEEASREFVKVLALDPGNVTAHNDLGVIYFRQGRYADARREFETVLSIDPGNAIAARDLPLVNPAGGSPTPGGN